MSATTCASEGTAGRKVILLASAMVRHATQRRLGKKADLRSLVQPATWPALAEPAGEQPSARRHPPGSSLTLGRLSGSSSCLKTARRGRGLTSVRFDTDPL